MNNDDQKHTNASGADEGIADSASPLGHAPEDVEDIDETLKGVGLSSDEDGPHELNSGKVIAEADKHQE